MSDEADTARKLQATLNESAARFRKPVPAIKPVGWCHYCNEDVAPGKLFCSGECATDFDKVRNL